MNRERQVKILATLGPASSDYETIKALFLAGADVFRLNMSHGTQEEQRERYDKIRHIERELNRPIGVLADLQGPKIRCGTFADGPTDLEVGAAFRFDSDDSPGDDTRVCLPHPEVLDALHEGASLLVNDGKVRLKVTEVGPGYVDCQVEVGGEISDRKGVSFPDVLLPVAALSDKDKSDLEFACEMGADWIALSFVQRPEDVLEAKELVAKRAAVLSKIEKPAAVKDFQAILAASDGIMVARGDLGVEMPLSEVPSIQKQLVRDCRAVGKPVIVATQMLESMITAPVPTRAEVSDVAGAIYDGADAVMLSAESAAGNYPVEAVATMNQVAVTVERDRLYRGIMEAGSTPTMPNLSAAIANAAKEIAETIDVKAICCFTFSGTTALNVAKRRPRVPIVALTPFEPAARRLTLVWGLRCVNAAPVGRFKMAVVEAVRGAKSLNIGSKGDRIVVVAGVPFNRAGTTNILRVAPLDEQAVFEGETSD